VDLEASESAGLIRFDVGMCDLVGFDVFCGPICESLDLWRWSHLYNVFHVVARVGSDFGAFDVPLERVGVIYRLRSREMSLAEV